MLLILIPVATFASMIKSLSKNANPDNAGRWVTYARPAMQAIEQIWKEIKREISSTFIHYVEYLRSGITEAFYNLSVKTSYAREWILPVLISQVFVQDVMQMTIKRSVSRIQ